MAKSDYYLCDLCYRKAFYDSGCSTCEGVDYEYNTGDIKAICNECSKTHKVIVEEKTEFEKAIEKGIEI